MRRLSEMAVGRLARTGREWLTVLQLPAALLGGSTVVDAQGPVDDAAQSVYAAVLADHVEETGTGLLLVRDSTARAGLFEARAAEEMSGVPDALREAFLAVNQTSIPLRIVDAAAGVPVWTITADELRSFPSPREGIWPALHAAYPSARGYLELSRVGFTPGGDEALVKLEESCGQLCGYYTLLYLRRIDGRWRIVERNLLMMS